MEDLTEEPELEECEQEEQVDGKEEDTNSDPGNEAFVRPVRQNVNIVQVKPLLQTNFSITGINEIRTERIDHPGYVAISGNNEPPLRPVSLTFCTFKMPPINNNNDRVQKFKTKLIDSPTNS